MSDGEEERSGTFDATTEAAVRSVLNGSIGSFTDLPTEVTESRLTAFEKRFTEENPSNVERAVKKARRENYTCRRKGNQQLYSWTIPYKTVLQKVDSASDALKSKNYGKVRALGEVTELVAKRIKTIKLADKSEFGWLTVNE